MKKTKKRGLAQTISSTVKGTVNNLKTAVTGDNSYYGQRTSIQQGAKNFMQGLKKRQYRRFGAEIKDPNVRKLARGMKGFKK